MFTLRMLGGFALEGADGAPVPLPTRKARLLLAMLALPPGVPHGREKLAALLWPDRGAEQARGSLRNALAALRAALGAEALEAGGDSVALRAGLLRSDVEALAAGELVAGADRELLEGIGGASEAADEWLAFERHRARGLAQAAFEAAMDRALAADAGGEAMALGRRLVALDPLRERSHRRLMEACLAAGERSQAMAQFQACEALLRRELGVGPSAETRRLAERLVGAPSVVAEVGASAPDGRFALAVLPFAHAPEDAVLADGFVEDLITELTRRREFNVIASQSSRIFAGSPALAPTAAAELGARWALIGSLRKGEGVLRITAQLLDGATRRVVWADRFDRPLADLFAVQDEVLARVLAALDAGLRDAEREHAARTPLRDLDAWTLFHRGLWHAYRFTPEEASEAERCFRAAAERARGFALPLAGLGYVALVRTIWFFAPVRGPALPEGIASAEQAVALDPDGAFGRMVLGRLLTMAGEPHRALAHLERAVETNPGFAQAHYGLAQAKAWIGQPAEALGHLDHALALSPKDPLSSMFLTLKAFCLLTLGRVGEAEAAAQTAIALRPTEAWARLALALALTATGQADRAASAVAEARRLRPDLTLADIAAVLRHVREDTRERTLAALAAAGLPRAPADPQPSHASP